MALDAEAPAVRAASPADDAGLHTLWATAFDAPLMVPTWSLDPLRHDRTIVAVEADGTVVASVVGLPRQIRSVDRTTHRVIGVANVATLPSARGKGHARRLLAELVDRSRLEGYDWALLFTGTPGVYEGSGWTTFTQQHRTGTLRDDAPLTGSHRPSRTRLVLTRRESTPQTWQALATLHDAAIAPHPLTTVRDDLDRRRTALWHAASAVFVAETDDSPGHPVGYVVVDTTQTARVVELAAESDEVSRFLLQAAATHVSSEGHRRLTLRLPDSPLLEQMAAELLTDVGWTHDRTGMTYPLRVDAERVRALVEHPLAHHSTGDYL